MGIGASPPRYDCGTIHRAECGSPPSAGEICFGSAREQRREDPERDTVPAMHQRGRLGSAVVLGCAFGAVLLGCGVQESQARRLDEQISEGARRLRAVGTEFGSTLRPFLVGEVGDSEALRAAHTAMAAEVNQLRAELGAATEALPLSGAEDYVSEYARFLELQREFVEGPYAELVELLNTASAPSPDAVAAAGATVRDVASRETRALEDLRDARARFRLAVGS